MSTLAQELEPEIPKEEIEAAEQQTETKEAPKAEAKEEIKELVSGEEEKPRAEKLVKIQALDAERHERKEIQAQLQKEQQERAILAGRLAQLYEVANPKTAIPDEAEDPLRNHAARLAEQERFRQQIEEERAQQAAYAQQQQQYRAFTAEVTRQEREFARTAEDYPAAVNFLRDRRVAELEAAGYGPEEVASAIANDAAMIATRALQNGMNPAEALYNMAMRTGYVKKGAEKPSGAEKIETLRKGTEAAKTLGNGQASGVPTPEQIVAMSDEEFEELKRDLKKKGKSLTDLM